MKARLSKEQIEYIKNLSLELFDSLNIWVFGSRADLNKKGGDIDIYIQVNNKKDILKPKIIFLREFEKKFGEQRLDLLIDNNTKNKKIFEIAKKEGVKI